MNSTVGRCAYLQSWQLRRARLWMAVLIMTTCIERPAARRKVLPPLQTPRRLAKQLPKHQATRPRATSRRISQCPRKCPIAAATSTKLKKKPFGKLPDGREVTQFTLENANGLTVTLIDYGAIVTTVETYDRDGNKANINLGFPKLDGYLERHPYFGSTVGRYANRIAAAKFTLDGKEYTLFANDGANHLHGGKAGLDKVLWKAEPIETATRVGVKFVYDSPDGEEGYPGKLNVSASYVLDDDNELT